MLRQRIPNISRPLMHTYSTFIDRSGLLWIGSSGYGILKRNTRSETFNHTGTTYNYFNKGSPITGKLLSEIMCYLREVFDKTKGELVGLQRTTRNGTKRSLMFLPLLLIKAVHGLRIATGWCYDTASKKRRITLYLLQVTMDTPT
jgi:hypothetical protein